MTRAVVYVDVDDTLVRTYGAKRIAMGRTVAAIRELATHDVVLYCWSSGGADYCREVCEELEIAELFKGFLPKPNILVDDVRVESGRRFVQLHPNCSRPPYVDHRTPFRPQTWDHPPATNMGPANGLGA